MSLCINPSCPKPQNLPHHLFCQTCGSELLLDGHYKVAELLSDKGGFSKTYKVVDLDKNCQIKVLKVLTLTNPKAVKLFQQEAVLLQRLNHPGIPRGDGYMAFFPKNSPTPLHCLVMEYIQGMDLETYLQERGRPINQKMALKWLKQIAQILQVIHGEKFFHRDIKPANIILQPNGKLVLIDFGTAREITATYTAKHNSGAITKITSAGFTPPEQENHRAVPQSDFFALGRTFVYLLTGKSPNDPAIYDSYNNELKWREFAPEISPLLADLIDELMAVKASQRPQSPEVILQKLAKIEAKIEYQLNLPLNPPPKPPKPQPRKFPSQVISQPNFNRRKLAEVAQFGNNGLGGVAVMDSFLLREDNSHPFKTRADRFSFTTVKVNDRGEKIDAKTLQAEYFTEDLGNGVTLDMVAIPGGTFMMGSPETEKGRHLDESPQHLVTVRTFFIAKYLVTQVQWQAVMGNSPADVSRANCPVTGVSWCEAVKFCRKLSQITGKNYRLPSEAEWEYACRARTTTPFYFGETITANLANYDGTYTYGNEPQGIYRGQPTDVGSFPPNGFGLYDMHGNVWEWCQDVWHENYYGAPTDGHAWKFNGNSSLRVLRGGSWCYSPNHCRCAARNWYGKNNKYNDSGFRVCYSPSAAYFSFLSFAQNAKDFLFKNG